MTPKCPLRTVHPRPYPAQKGGVLRAENLEVANMQGRKQRAARAWSGSEVEDRSRLLSGSRARSWSRLGSVWHAWWPGSGSGFEARLWSEAGK